MRISIIAVGTRMPAWVVEGVQEYEKRLPRELNLTWREIPLKCSNGSGYLQPKAALVHNP